MSKRDKWRDCRYVHDRNLKMPKANSVRVICKYYADGWCSVGEKCIYLHEKKDKSERLKPATQKKNSLTKKKVEKSFDELVDESSVKLDVLPLKDFPIETDKKEEKPTAQWKNSEISDEHEQEYEYSYNDEEVYFYGAPGAFEESKRLKEDIPKVSYRKIVGDEHLEDTYNYTNKVTKTKSMCVFYQQGLCRYGDSCLNSHENAMSDDASKVQEEISLSKDLECNICYDVILEKGERFGLLSGCSHPFCLSCVRNWRENVDQPKETVRQCPVCRVETHFIVPSNRMITDTERKNAVFASYCANLSQKACRHFDEGRGTCPFGTSCFYAHKYPDGREAERVVRTAVDSSNNYDVLPQLQLNHFINI